MIINDEFVDKVTKHCFGRLYGKWERNYGGDFKHTIEITDYGENPLKELCSYIVKEIEKQHHLTNICPWSDGFNAGYNKCLEDIKEADEQISEEQECVCDDCEDQQDFEEYVLDIIMDALLYNKRNIKQAIKG